MNLIKQAHKSAQEWHGQWTGHNDEQCDKHCKHEWVWYEGGWSNSMGEIDGFSYCKKCGLPEDHSGETNE